MDEEVPQLPDLIALPQNSVPSYVVLERLDGHNIKINFQLSIQNFAEEVASVEVWVPRVNGYATVPRRGKVCVLELVIEASPEFVVFNINIVRAGPFTDHILLLALELLDPVLVNLVA